MEDGVEYKHLFINENNVILFLEDFTPHDVALHFRDDGWRTWYFNYIEEKHNGNR